MNTAVNSAATALLLAVVTLGTVANAQVLTPEQGGSRRPAFRPRLQEAWRIPHRLQCFGWQSTRRYPADLHAAEKRDVGRHRVC